MTVPAKRFYCAVKKRCNILQVPVRSVPAISFPPIPKVIFIGEATFGAKFARKSFFLRKRIPKKAGSSSDAAGIIGLRNQIPGTYPQAIVLGYMRQQGPKFRLTTASPDSCQPNRLTLDGHRVAFSDFGPKLILSLRECRDNGAISPVIQSTNQSRVPSSRPRADVRTEGKDTRSNLEHKVERKCWVPTPCSITMLCDPTGIWQQAHVTMMKHARRAINLANEDVDLVRMVDQTWILFCGRAMFTTFEFACNVICSFGETSE